MRANKKLMILGAGAHARVLVDLAQQLPGWDLAGLLDDDSGKAGGDVFGVPVLGRTDQLLEIAAAKITDCAAIAFGDNTLRRRFFEFATESGLEPATLVHPSAIISPNAKLGAGVIVLAGVIVNAGAVIGDNVCLNTGCRIDHDCRLDDHSHIFPSATLTGGVSVGSGATVGANAVVNPNLKIGKDAFVGSGAVVIRNVEGGEVVVGNPARVLDRRSQCAEGVD